MDNWTLNFLFWLYLIALPWLGLVRYLVFSRSGPHWLGYSLLIVVGFLLSTQGFVFVPLEVHVIAWAVMLYMCFELCWASLLIRNRILRWILPVLGIGLNYAAVFAIMAASLAGGRVFSEQRVIARFEHGIWDYEIVQTGHADTGVSWNTYALYQGVALIPIRYTDDKHYGGKGCRDCVEAVRWRVRNNQVIAELVRSGLVVKTFAGNKISLHPTGSQRFGM
jgi:hypothetical protein